MSGHVLYVLGIGSDSRKIRAKAGKAERDVLAFSPQAWRALVRSVKTQ